MAKPPKKKLHTTRRRPPHTGPECAYCAGQKEGYAAGKKEGKAEGITEGLRRALRLTKLPEGQGWSVSAIWGAQHAGGRIRAAIARRKKREKR